jgi:hypothetical protein
MKLAPRASDRNNLNEPQDEAQKALRSRLTAYWDEQVCCDDRAHQLPSDIVEDRLASLLRESSVPVSMIHRRSGPMRRGRAED